MLRSKKESADVKIHNELGAGSTFQKKETMRFYRIQGKTIKEIAELYFCSVGLVHKIISENK